MIINISLDTKKLGTYPEHQVREILQQLGKEIDEWNWEDRLIPSPFGGKCGHITFSVEGLE